MIDEEVKDKMEGIKALLGMPLQTAEQKPAVN